MATFLRIIAFVYLAVIWLPVFMSMSILPTTTVAAGHSIAGIVVLVAIVLSVPAAILYAFGQLVSYARRTTEHLAFMRSFIEQRGGKAT